MDKSESVQEKETNKILLDFEIQADHSIPERLQDIIIIQELAESWNLSFWTGNRMKIRENVERETGRERETDRQTDRDKQVRRPCHKTAKVV